MEKLSIQNSELDTCFKYLLKCFSNRKNKNKNFKVDIWKD